MVVRVEQLVERGFLVQSVLNNMAGVETCFLKLSEELN